jgi:hypothetical protein
VAVLAPALWMWRFTVDDALISVRYARHLASGAGWRFNAGGASTDGVTPLPWPVVLAPLAHAGALTVLARAKALGLGVSLVAGAALGVGIGRVERAPLWARMGTLAVVGLCIPLAAHSVSGMETAIATSLATAAALAETPIVAAALAGAATAFRPEMAPWACVLAGGLALARRDHMARAWLPVAVALAPFVACAILRLVVWGQPVPLAVEAKPSSLAIGCWYAAMATAATLTPCLVLAPLALAREPRALTLVMAAVAHLAALVVVGGDWMPGARLMVPIAPSLAYAGALLAAQARPLATAARTILALGLGVAEVAIVTPAGRTVGVARAALVDEARPVLAGATRIAAIDIGWLGAATEADIVDLAGVTDPVIAALPGGHTSKHVDAALLLSYRPDALLLYVPPGLPDGALASWREATFNGAVETRLAHDDTIARRFTPSAWLPLGPGTGGYVLLRAR